MKKISQETREKMSRAKRGKSLSMETRRKMSLAQSGEKHPNYGKKFSKELRAKLSESHKGQISWNKGKKLSEETKRKIGEGRKGKTAGEKHPLYGKHHTAETKRKMSESHSGSKCYAWKGGISNSRRTDNYLWKEIRDKIYKRDNWTCQICKKHCYKDIQCHHIIPYRITQDNSEENLIVLCKSCHIKEEKKYYNSLKEVKN